MATALCIQPAAADGMSQPETGVIIVESGCYGVASVEAEAASVRSGPGDEHPILAQLASGAEVYVCERQGNWRGVVYAPDGLDCALSEGIGQPYRGPCASGWLPADTLAVTAS